MAEYSEVGDQVKRMASDLIDNYHSHLGPARIAFIFRDKAIKSGGKKVMAKASKLGGKYKALTGLNNDHPGFDFLIEIAQDEWMNLNNAQKKALLDHELSHCGRNENGWKIWDHDFTGFSQVLERHGFWSSDLKKLKSRMQQMELPMAGRFQEDRGELKVVEGK